MAIRETRDAAIVELAIDRPEARNALNTETIRELTQALAHWAQDPTVHAVIVTGTGDRAFCAGADLKEVQQLDGVDARRRYFGGVATLLETMAMAPQLVIAAIFGYTLAGGLGLAAGADFVVAADDTQGGLPEIHIGLFPMVVMAPIARAIGPRRTLELVMSGRLVDVATLDRWGFCNRVVPKDQLHAEAWRFAREITPGSAAIRRLGKDAWRTLQDLPYRDALQYLKNMVSLVAMTEDSAEGVNAYLAHRDPNWRHQ
jgi:enoyl-CoA hydratase/carnithine racemase